ncbi:uncharacterized protein KY384_008915 [Bacidia gigantensis]|uniref:uncharacterized protein n=1 Tax=Bacidia gigantensis TaxID=2732470 RepID=UPI001D04D650|nr:uncharacterized protein KY384_008915 [Bacidia gigantensis]KAG8525271.1 hypothetical protein KY384_008915 [Bacidia gigantensis]
MSVSSEERTRYVPIIDSILAASDLNTISEKRIRKGLQAAVDHDLNLQKDAIKALIMERFDKKMADEAPKTNGHAHASSSEERSSASTPKHVATSPPNPKKHKHDDDDDEMSDVIDEPKPKKKRKPSEDTDAAYAAKLQAMENARSRTTRGGGSKPSKPAKKKKTPKKKSAGRVKAEDDSDIDGSGSDVKERKVNRNTGFHKELLLSAPLSALLNNEIKLSRPQTVKKIWEYVRANDLQDQTDKRNIICDDAMRAVFKSDKIHMFTMNKILGQNLYPQDE